MRRLPTSAVAGRSSRHARRSTPPPTREEAVMNLGTKINRRAFVAGTFAVGGGLAIGLDIPLGAAALRAAAGSPEANARAGIRPPDTAAIPTPRSQTAHHTLTLLAHPTPTQLQPTHS